MGLNPSPTGDDKVNSLLDELIANGRLNSNVVEADPVNSQQDVVFVASTVFEGLDAVNNILTNTGVSPPLPPLSEDSSNATAVLAAALSTLVRLSRANSANIKLRQQADTLSNDACNRLEQLQSEILSTRQKSETHATSAARNKQQAAAAMQALGESERRHNTEVSELRSSIQKYLAKERQLLKEAKRRETEFAKLRQRVHELIKTSHSNKPLMPRVTCATSSTSSRTKTAAADGESISRAIAIQSAEQAQNALHEVFAAENDTFRDILRSVQEDMDELLCLCDYSVSRGVGYEKNLEASCSTDIHETDQNSEISTAEKGEGGENTEETATRLKEGSSWEQVLASDDIIGAPTEDQMRLPFELIREEFEDSLEQKFRVVRDALTMLRQDNASK